MIEDEIPQPDLKRSCDECGVDLPDAWEGDLCGNCQAAAAQEAADMREPSLPVVIYYGAVLPETKVRFAHWAGAFGMVEQLKVVGYDGPVVRLASYEALIRFTKDTPHRIKFRWFQEGDQFTIYPLE